MVKRIFINRNYSLVWRLKERLYAGEKESVEWCFCVFVCLPLKIATLSTCTFSDIIMMHFYNKNIYEFYELALKHHDTSFYTLRRHCMLLLKHFKHDAVYNIARKRMQEAHSWPSSLLGDLF